MDLLFSLGLGNNLPEHSTRLTSPGVAQALDRSEKVCLGFDSCLNCGSRLSAFGDDVGSVNVSNGAVACEGCRRVRYCSTACRKADSEDENSLRRDGDEGEPAAGGHSPVICALLNLCNDDDAAEDELLGERNASGNRRNKNGKANQEEVVDRKREAARYRLQTEMESYPATLFNIPTEAPNWFGEAITRRLRHEEDVRSPEFERRRGKRDRNYSSTATQSDKRRRKRELALHIVGASAESELWGWNGAIASNVESKADTSVLSAYAEASMNLVSYVKNLLEASISIRCIFIGPDCPASSPCCVEVPIPDSRSSTLTIETHCCNYGDAKQPYLPPPDAIVFFNPGFSCTDYDWSGALASAAAYQLSPSSLGPTPFLIATNTEMEGYADVKHLLDRGYLDARTLPEDILEAMDNPTCGEGSEEASFIFGKNPYVGLRVRQSGTLGNDLFVKNRWVLAGLFSGGRRVTPSKKRKKAERPKHNTVVEGNKMKRKERRGEKQSNTGCRNSKRRNPALI